MSNDLIFDRLHRDLGIVLVILMFCIALESSTVGAIEPPNTQTKPTDAEKKALVEIEKLVGRQFTVNENGAVVQGVLGGHELTAAVLEHLAELRNLRTLYLHRTEITNDGMKCLREMTNLRKLYLGETAVGDAGLEHLMGLTNLEYLHLGNTKVSGEGTKYLKGLTNLKILHLFDTNVNDAGLANLQGLSKLQLVSLSSSTVTAGGVRKLQQALPKLVITGNPRWAAVHPDSAKELSVSIAVPARDSKRTIDIRKPDSHFNVVVTNRSKHDLRLWETWNSWGYYNLSFDVLDGKDNVLYSIVKRPRAWTVNGATWVTVKPGEHFVLKVDFDHDIWVRDDLGDDRRIYVPFLALMRTTPEFKLKLRAVFQILPDDETIEKEVWTGTVKSAPDDFVIHHTPQKAANEPNQTARSKEDKTHSFSLAKAAKTKDVLRRSGVFPAKWTWLEHNGMQIGIGVVDLPTVSEPYIEVFGYVYNRHFKEWRSFCSASLRNVFTLNVELDKKHAVLKLLDGSNNDGKGKVVLQWNLAYLSDDR